MERKQVSDNQDDSEEADDEDDDGIEDDEGHHRLLSHSDVVEVHSLIRTSRYALTLMNKVDLVAVLPFWLTYSGLMGDEASNFSVVRILRLARIFRVFRIGKFSEGLGLFTTTMAASSPALVLLGFFYVLGCVLFGSIMFFAEKGVFMVSQGQLQSHDHSASEHQ